MRTHVYRVRARLIKWKHETDSDYHLVLTDDPLRYTDDSAGVQATGHSVIGEIPDQNCVSGAHATFGTSTPFQSGISAARSSLDQQFPNADQSGAWNERMPAIEAAQTDELSGMNYSKPQQEIARKSQQSERGG